MTLQTPPPVGIHYGVPADVYHGWPAVSNSWLSKLRSSPAHLADLIEHGSTPSTAAQDFGTAVHCAVLEPDTFKDRYAIRPEEMNGTTKAGRAFKEAADEAGQIVLGFEDYARIQAIGFRVKTNRTLWDWLGRDHQTEVSLVWKRDGYFCRARADLVIPELNIIADLKTTITASREGFARQVAKYHYHTQAAWYCEGMRALTGEEWRFCFIAVEKRRPYLVSLHELMPGSAAHGAAIADMDRLFEEYKRCIVAQDWPGYGDMFEIELPAWALTVSDAGDEEPFD